MKARPPYTQAAQTVLCSAVYLVSIDVKSEDSILLKKTTIHNHWKFEGLHIFTSCPVSGL